VPLHLLNLEARVIDDLVPLQERAVLHGVGKRAGVGENKVVVSPIVRHAHVVHRGLLPRRRAGQEDGKPDDHPEGHD
jgi:hypothetical protein